MKLIDRYIYQVGKHLPSKMRADVQVELRSLIEDRFEDREVKGKNEEEAAIVAILQQLGPPKKIANSYAPPQKWLIGEQLFPTFFTVVVILLAIIGGGYLIALAFSLENFTGAALLDSLIPMLPNLLSAAFEAIGVVVVTFAILERITSIGDSAPEKWDPRKLPTVSDQDDTDNTWLIIETCFLILFLLLLNFFPERVGGFFQINDQTMFVPLLAPEFINSHLPLLNLWWGLGIGLNLVVIWRRQWQGLTRIADLALNMFGVYVIYYLLTGPQIIGLNSLWIENETTIATLVNAETISGLTSILNAFLIIALIVMVIILITQIFQLLRRFKQKSANILAGSQG